MTISEIRKLLGAQIVTRSSMRAAVSGLTMHSREVRPGFVFLAIAGTHQNGLTYVDDAIRRGAIAIVAEEAVRAPAGVTVLKVKNCRLAAAKLASTFFGDPSRHLRVAGITGTNGKTTTAALLKAALEQHGISTGMIGTIAYEIGNRSISATRTTPDCVTLQHLLSGMVKSGCKAAVMEVSSHALVQQRTADVDFDAVGFTNLTQDHLDYHETMEAYFDAKASLFRALPAGRVGVVNVDDPWGARLAAEPLACDILRTGVSADADVAVSVHATSLEGSRITLSSPWGTYEAVIQLAGKHNVSNAVLCFAMACAMGVPADTVAAGLCRVHQARGRLQRISSTAPFAVFVDYTHTDDALRCVLQELRRYTPGKLRVVFGCGGGRDRSKRALMGGAVHAHSDVTYVTTDNPRNEAPAAIIEDILQAFPADACVTSEVDREAAIRLALFEAAPGDTVCIAGKGHETYQEVEGRMLPFDDVEVALQFLREKGYGEA